MTIYVVMGGTGEYSDRQEWPVRAFATEAHAQAFVAAAEVWLLAHDVSRRSDGIADYEERERLEASCPFDPNAQFDYSGTTYWLLAVPLDAEVVTEIAAEIAAQRPPRVIELDEDTP